MGRTVVTFLIAFTFSGPAVAAEPAGPPAPPAGEPASYWGPVGPPSESNRAPVEGRSRSAAARALDAPAKLALLPADVVLVGVQRGTGWATESALVQKATHLFPIRLGPTSLGAGVSYGGDTGLGGSLALDAPGFLEEGGRLRLRLSGTTRGEGKATLGTVHPLGAGTTLQLGTGYRSERNARFFGIGPQDANRGNESFYREETGWGGAHVRRTIGSGGWAATLGSLYSSVSATGGDDSRGPRLTETFGPDAALSRGPLPSGYRDRSEGLSHSLELSHDTTRRADRPAEGGIRRVKAGYFHALSSGQADFWTYRAEAQQFLPLWLTDRTLALRGYASWIDARGGRPVAFQRLLTNDEPDVLRGYADDRFRDRGIWGATAEYRWPLWVNRQADGTGVDAYLFTDLGQVFGDRDHAFDDMTTSWGGGLRLGGFGRFRGRIEVGRGHEGTELRVRADQILQYARGDLLHGRTPVPER